MAQILSNDEIERLFAESSRGDDDEPEQEKTKTPSKTLAQSCSSFDFTKPNRFSPQHIQGLWRLHEMAASRIQLSLSTTLRLGVRVELMDLEQVRFEAFVSRIPTPSVISILEAPPLRYGAMLAMDYELAYAMLERLLGGGGATEAGEPRELSQLEFVVIDGLLDIVFRDFSETWKKTVPIEFRTVSHESNPQYCRVLPPKEVVIAVTYGIGGELGFGEMRMALPHLGLEPYLDKLLGTSGAVPAAETAADKHRSLPKLKSAEVDSRLVLGNARIPLRDIISLSVGDIVPLDRGLHDHAELEVAGQPKFLGKTVMHQGSLAFLVEDNTADSPTDSKKDESHAS